MVISFAAAEVLSEENLAAVVFGLGYAHYGLGLKYSKRGVENAWTKSRPKALLIGAVIGAFLLAGKEWAVPGIVTYFGVHHAISEAYFSPESPSIRNAHGVVVLGTYISIIFRQLQYVPYGQELGWVLTAAGIIALLAASKGNRQGLIQRFPWLIIGPAFLVISHWVPVTWLVLTLFHFVFWAMLPLLRPGMIKGDALKKYWKETAWTNGLCVLGTVGLLKFAYAAGNSIPFSAMRGLFYAWSYLHISWSFVVSGANPKWVKRAVGVA